MAAEPYRYVRKGRSWAAVIAVLLTWAACLAAVVIFQAALWIVGLILLFTLPAVWDLWSGATAGTELRADQLSWYSGRRRVDLPLSDIDHVRLVTRFDFSVRAAVLLRTGRKLRLPAEATPPHGAFEAALHAHGLRTERHHFTPL